MAKPWKVLDTIDTDEGVLELRQRHERDFLVTVAGLVLMNNRDKFYPSKRWCVSGANHDLI